MPVVYNFPVSQGSTAGQGLTQNGNKIDLGGNSNQNIVITINDNTFEVQGDTAADIPIMAINGDHVVMDVFNTFEHSTVFVGGGGVQIQTENNAGTLNANMLFTPGIIQTTGKISFALSTDGIVVTDSVNPSNTWLLTVAAGVVTAVPA